MNQLFKQQGASNQAPLSMQQSPLSKMQQMSQLLQFIKTTSPQQAKYQVEQLVKEQGISQQEFESVKKQASEIAKAIGLS